jgi:uncharacterized membrane protein
VIPAVGAVVAAHRSLAVPLSVGVRSVPTVAGSRVAPPPSPGVLAATGGSHGLFDVLVVLHVICAVVGFGSLALSGVYGFTSRHPAGPEAVEEARRYFRSPGRLELAVLAVPVFGVAALGVQPGGGGLGQLWALLALGIWLTVTIVLIGVIRPAEARLRAVLVAPSPDEVAMATAAGRLGWASVVTDLGFFVALMLMILQPR